MASLVRGAALGLACAAFAACGTDPFVSGGDAGGDTGGPPDAADGSSPGDAPGGPDAPDVRDAPVVSSPMMLAGGLNNPHGIAVDGSWAYVAEYGGGRVVRIPKTGGSPSPLVPTTTPNANDIVVDSSYAYFTYGTSGSALGRVPIGGGPVTPFIASPGSPGGVAQDLGFVYWTTTSGQSVMQLDKVTSTYRTLANVGGVAQYVAVDNANVYVTLDSGAVVRVPKTGVPDGGAAAVVTNGAANAFVITVALPYVIFTTHNGSGGVFRVMANATGASAAPLHGNNSTYHHGIATYSSNVYWLRGTTPAAVVKAGADGTGAFDLVSGTSPPGNHPWGIAVDSGYVYWTNASDGTVWRAPR